MSTRGLSLSSPRGATPRRGNGTTAREMCNRKREPGSEFLIAKQTDNSTEGLCSSILYGYLALCPAAVGPDGAECGPQARRVGGLVTQRAGEDSLAQG